MVKNYIRPGIVREVRCECETAFLTGSVVDSIAAVESTGQEVKEYDFSDDTSFNHNWE